MLATASSVVALLLVVTGAVPAASQAVGPLSGVLDTRVSASPEPGILQHRARLQVEQVRLPTALALLSERSGIPLAYSPSLLPDDHRVTCLCDKVSVREALDQLLAGTSFQYTEVGAQVLIEPSFRRRSRDQNLLPSTNAPLRTTYASLQGLPVSSAVLVRPEGRETRFVGVITGRVVESASQRPLASVQVSIPEAGLGTLTDNAGRFQLQDVPEGQVTIRAQMIGFSVAEQTVRVTSGQVSTVSFSLTTQALALDEIVVTGTPGGTQRRAVGNVVDRLDATELMVKAPGASVQQLLGQRNPGIYVSPGTGQVGGTGGVIRIRGVSSLSQNNEPLVYIDGVRMDAGRSGPGTREGRNISRLNDLNPEDIESMEVIKGPAAATLYGTEASAGVIQIITKKGAQGTPSVDLVVKQGATWLQDPAGRLGNFYYKDPRTGELDSFNLYEHEKIYGNGPVFQTGHLQSYTVSMRGGTDQVRYFLSADWDDDEGIVDYNWSERVGLRANLNLMPHPTLDLGVSTGFINGTSSLMQQYSGWDIWSNLLWGSPLNLRDDNRLRGFLRATPEAIAEIEALAKINRFTGSVQANHRPREWLAQRLIVGFDVADETNSIYFPRHPQGQNWFFGAQSLGEKRVERPKSTNTTVDYSATASLDLTRGLRSATSAGLQYYVRQREYSEAFGRNFPAPFVGTVGGAAVTFGDEDFIENKTAGVFVQQQFDWNNRLFVTGAVRGDDNSAFGANFDAAIYPKLSATWVINEEPFWGLEPVSTLRLRTAWGAAGQQPDVFAAIRLYDPATGPGDGSVLTPGALGNPDLKPERGEELEVGFDAGLLQDRINLKFTYYTRTTKDAIVQRALPPSVGFPGAQFVNVGETKNWGTETSLDAQVLSTPRLGWDLGLSFATMKNRITSLGGVPPISFGSNMHVEGYPIGSFFWWRIVSADLDARGQVVNEMCEGGPEFGDRVVPCAEAPRVYWGRPDPTWELGVNSTLTLFRNLQLYARVDARGGNMARNNDLTSSHTSYQNTLMSNLQDDPIFMAYRKIGRDPLAFYDAYFGKLREVSATFNIPSGWMERLRSSRGSVTVAGTHLWTFWAQRRVTVPGIGEIPDPQIWDPEMRGLGQMASTFQSVIPPLASVITSIRFTF